MLELERRATTIVAADVVGYTRLVSAAEEEVFSRLRALRLDIINPAIDAEGGRVVKTMGDGILIEFPAPDAAVRASRAVQRSVDQHEKALPEVVRISLRIGINHGSVIVDGEDILGDAVNIAARLETLAPPGGICVSRSVRDMLGAELAADVSSQGVQYVRNIPNPVEVWGVETGVAGKSLNLQQSRSDRPSILVLPFDNRSSAEDDGFLADGITDDVISELSRFRSLFVIARGTSFAYKGKTQDVSQIAQDTGVRYVVTGNVRRAGQRLRASAQLVETATGQVIWNDKFDRDIDDIFALQDAISKCVVTGVTPEIGAHERNISRRKPTESLSAWELCQRGLTEFDNRSRVSVANAYALYHEAVKADPNYALPHALLARLHAVRIYSGRSKDLKTDVAEGMKHASISVQLDDRLETGHVSMAQLLVIQGRIADARDALARAKALNDNDAFLYSAQTYINLFQVEPDTAEMEAAGLEAVRLSPTDPLAWSYNWMLVMAVWMRDMELGENVRHYLETASRLPGADAFVHIAVAVTCLKRDDLTGAQRAVTRAIEIRPDLSLGNIRNAFHFPKWKALVGGVSDQLEAMVPMGLPEN